MPKTQPKKPFQIQRMFGLARKPADAAGIPVKEYLEEIAVQVTRRDDAHLSELTFDQANDMIARLGGTPFARYGHSKRTENYRKQKAGIKTIETNAHVEFIRKQAERRNMTEEGIEKLATRMNLPWPTQTTEQGNKLAEALKSMNKRDGLMPAVRTDPTVFRAFLRVLNILDSPDAMISDPEVVGRILELWQARGERPDPPADGPSEEEMLRILAVPA